MISKVQMLKSAIDSHPTVRFLQRKLNLEGCAYRRLRCDEDEFEPLLDITTLQQETLKSNEAFHYSKIQYCEENVDSFNEVKLSRQENTVRVKQNNFELNIKGPDSSKVSLGENQDPNSEDRQTAHAKVEPLKILEVKTEGFQYSERFCHEKPDTSSEIAKPQSSKTVQQENLRVKAGGFIYSKSSCRESSDFSHTKTIQAKKLVFKSEILHSSKSSCEENEHSSSGPVKKPTDTNTAQRRDVEFKLDDGKPIQEKIARQKDVGDIHSSKSSSRDSSNNSPREKKARNTKRVQERQFKPQGFRYSKLSEDNNDDHGVKKQPRKKKTAQKESSTLASPAVNRDPGWQDNNFARERLSQRRTAVCDNIEKQLRDQYGTSLRNMRKYLVMEEALRETNLI